MNNSLIGACLDTLTLGDCRVFRSLAVHPLLASTSISSKRDYLTLDEALKAGQVQVSEVSERGSVPELLLKNTAPTGVLLIDGEELVGAKQNRVLNLSILAPARAELRIPVSCVEAGRWQHNSPHFRTEGRSFFAEGRARKASKVTESMRAEGSFYSDQVEVWDLIAEKSLRMASHSETAAMSRIYEDHEEQLAHYLNAFGAEAAEVGAVFVVGSEVRGIEVFDHPQTFHDLFPKLLQSYALDALEANTQASTDQAPVLQALEALRSETISSHRSVGEGEDYRFTGPFASGGALHARSRIVHLYAFPVVRPNAH